MKRLLSIVVPVYNEAASLPRLSAELTAALAPLPYDYEIIFVNDGSSDASASLIEDLAASDSRIRYLEFSRNFGKEVATSAGIDRARGDAIILIDADLQHPPAFIPTLVEAWESGAEVAIGVRRSRPKEGFLRRLGSRSFSRMMNSISDIQAPAGATDFRLIDGTVAAAFRRMHEHRRMTRSLIDWLGFKRVYIPFDAAEREDGAARYGLGKLTGLAFSALVAHSRLPLTLAGYLGAGITVLATFLGVFVLIEQPILGDPLGLAVSGSAMLAIMILFLNGVVLICLGLMALYVGTIHEEIAQRPLYVVRRTMNLGE